MKRRAERHLLDEIRKASENTSQERETIIWLAGLISTDGTIVDGRNHHHGFRFSVATVEEDWAAVMTARLREIGIGSSNYHYRVIKSSVPNYTGRTYPEGYILLGNPRAIVDLFLLYHCEKFFNPRKWQRVLAAKEFSKNAQVECRTFGELHHCSICKRWLPFADFHKNRAQPDGLDCRCKTCAWEQQKKRRLKQKMERWKKMFEPNLAVPTEPFNFSIDEQSHISLSDSISDDNSCSN